MKRRKTRKEHLLLILCFAHFPCLALNAGVVGKHERKRLSLYIIPARLHLPSVYIQGIRISKNEGTVMGHAGRTRAHYEREKNVPLILHLAFVL